MIKVSNKDWKALKRTVAFAHDMAVKNQAAQTQIDKQNRTINRLDQELYEIRELVKDKYPEGYQELIELTTQQAQTPIEERRKQGTLADHLAEIQKYRESHSAPSQKLREKKRTDEILRE